MLSTLAQRAEGLYCHIESAENIGACFAECIGKDPNNDAKLCPEKRRAQAAETKRLLGSQAGCLRLSRRTRG